MIEQITLQDPSDITKVNENFINVQEQIDTTNTGLANLNVRISNETSRATQAESALQTSINNQNATIANIRADVNTNTQDILTKQDKLTQGKGITLANNVISAKVNTNQGVMVDNNGISTKLGSGLEYDNNGNINVKNDIRSSEVFLLNKKENIQFDSNLEIRKSYSYTITANDINNYKNRFIKIGYQVDTNSHYTAQIIDVTARYNNKIIYKNKHEIRNQDQNEGDLLTPINTNSVNEGDIIQIELYVKETVENTDGANCTFQIRLF